MEKGGQTRYRLPETVRQYGSEKLDATGNETESGGPASVLAKATEKEDQR